MSVGEDDDDVCMPGLSDDDSAFTTEWELKVARKKVSSYFYYIYIYNYKMQLT